MKNYTPAWPHSEIKEIFPDIFFVTGTNKTVHDGVNLQHSRNMIIIRNQDELSLINTVRLTEQGLLSLDQLGKVKHILRIGAFHGRDDAFYLDQYHASLWALKGMQDEHGHSTHFELTTQTKLPFNASVFIFETSKFPEAILHINHEGGIIITCDSIKNWLGPDEYFNEESAKLYQDNASFGPASISKVWQQACQVDISDFNRLLQLPFRHLLSAHGQPLLHHAHEQVTNTINKL